LPLWEWLHGSSVTACNCERKYQWTRQSNLMMRAMKTKKSRLVACVVLAIAIGVTITARTFASDESDVRTTIQRVFGQLKSGEYGALYDGLPSSSRSRISKDRFVSGLQRTSNLYQLQRIEIGAVRASGNLAVAETTMYAHIHKPIDADGKLVVQQYRKVQQHCPIH